MNVGLDVLVRPHAAFPAETRLPVSPSPAPDTRTARQSSAPDRPAEAAPEPEPRRIESFDRALTHAQDRQKLRSTGPTLRSAPARSKPEAQPADAHPTSEKDNSGPVPATEPTPPTDARKDAGDAAAGEQAGDATPSVAVSQAGGEAVAVDQPNAGQLVVAAAAGIQEMESAAGSLPETRPTPGGDSAIVADVESTPAEEAPAGGGSPPPDPEPGLTPPRPQRAVAGGHRDEPHPLLDQRLTSGEGPDPAPLTPGLPHGRPMAEARADVEVQAAQPASVPAAPPVTGTGWSAAVSSDGPAATPPMAVQAATGVEGRAGGEANLGQTLAGGGDAQAAGSADLEGGQEVTLARVARGLQTALNQRGGVVSLRLTPPELGVLRIQMEIQDAQVRATFTTEHEAVQALLTHRMDHLRQALERQGLVVDRLQVQVQTSSVSAAPEAGQQGRSDLADDGRSRGQFFGEGRSDRQAEQRGQALGGAPVEFQERLVNMMA